jgi:hypothetical protein
MSPIKRLFFIILIACLVCMATAIGAMGPGGVSETPTKEAAQAPTPAKGGGGGSKSVDFEKLIKTLQDAKKSKPAKFEELQKLLYIKPFTTEEYDANLPMALSVEGNISNLSRNDNIKIFAYVENPNPIEIRRALYLYLEALEPGEKSFREVNLVPQIIQVNEYEPTEDNRNYTTRVFPDLTSFNYLKKPGLVLLRLKASDGVYELYSDNKTITITNNLPMLSGFKIVAPDQPRYNDPIEYISNATDVDGDMVNVTLHILDDRGKEERTNVTQVVKPGDKVVFIANQYGFFNKDDAGKNFTYYYSYGDGIAVNRTNTMFGPNLRKNIALWVEERPLVVPEEESQYWWQDYNFSVNMKNQDPGVARVSVSLFTDTEAHPWKIVDTKDVEVGQELRPVYFNIKPFDVLDAGKNFSFKFKYSELDQREKDSVNMRWIKPINEKLLKYDIASFPIVINLFGIMFAAVLCGILIERRFYR